MLRTPLHIQNQSLFAPLISVLPGPWNTGFVAGGLLTEDEERFPAFPASPRGRRGGQLGDHSRHGRVAGGVRLSFGDGRGDGGKLLLLVADRVCVKLVLCVLS